METTIPAPDQPDERSRLAELRAYAILDSEPESSFDELTALASYVCGMPISLVTLVDEERQWFKSEHGLGVRETDRAGSFCAHAVASGEMFVVPDARGDERFRDNPLVTGDPLIRFYAGAPLTNAEGHTLGTLCVIDREPRVLTDAQQRALRVLARQAMALLDLHRRNNELRELDRLKDDFVGAVSHELRTPLTSIIGYSDTLLEDDDAPLTDEQRHFVGIVRRNADRLVHLVGDLLFVAQVGTGRFELDRDPVDVAALARETAERLGPAARAKRIELVVDAEPVEANLDRQRIVQLIDNLAANAVKFTPDGGTVVLRVAADHAGAAIAVADTGIGIPEADVARLFDRFARA